MFPATNVHVYSSASKNPKIENLQISGKQLPGTLPDSNFDDKPEEMIKWSVSTIPKSKETSNLVPVTLGGIVQPFVQQPFSISDKIAQIPKVDFSDHSEGPLRCFRCRSYVNPFYTFINDGKNFVCNLCHAFNNVPSYYYCKTDVFGKRRDKESRVELNQSSIEFTAPEIINGTKIKNDTPFHCLFVIETTKQAEEIGAINCAFKAVKFNLENLPLNSNFKVGFVTFDSSVNFYKINKNHLEIITIGDLNHPICPVPSEKLFIPLQDEESRQALLDHLNSIESFISTPPNFSCFETAIVVSSAVLKETGGLINLFLSSKSTIGPFANPSKNKTQINCNENSKILNQNGTVIGKNNQFIRNSTKKSSKLANLTNFSNLKNSTHSVEKSTPEELRSNLRFFLSHYGIAVNSFLMIPGPHLTIDLSFIGQNGGTTLIYPLFTPERFSAMICSNLQHEIDRIEGYKALLVFRCSTGIKIERIMSKIMSKNEQEIRFPIIKTGQSFGIKLDYEDILDEKNFNGLQMAFLYTKLNGETVLRIHTKKLEVTKNISEMYKSMDSKTIMALCLKNIANSSFFAEKKIFVQACANILLRYCVYCSDVKTRSQLVIPDSLKTLPLLTLALMKNRIFKRLTEEEKIHFLHRADEMNVFHSNYFIYPLFNLIEFDDDKFKTSRISLSEKNFNMKKSFYIFNGFRAFIFIGENFKSHWENSEEFRQKLFDFLNQNSNFHLGDPNLLEFFYISDEMINTMNTKMYFVEDAIESDQVKGEQFGVKMSYFEFLSYLHRKIQKRLFY